MLSLTPTVLAPLEKLVEYNLKLFFVAVLNPQQVVKVWSLWHYRIKLQREVGKLVP